MVKETKDKFQRIDILVNDAAVNLPYRTVADLTLDEWNWVVGVNLTGTFLCSRAVLPEMMAQRWGKIINMASIGGRRGAAGRAPYRPTKAAVINFTECLAAEVKEYNIDVNAICPGAVETDMLREITRGEMPKNTMPPEDIAAVAVFLASDESRAVTGTAIDAFGRSNPLFGADTSVHKPR
jgi:NAD(P)-dependent dehydrogenase (short-subunit alcohol dehydrogenase family)